MMYDVNIPRNMLIVIRPLCFDRLRHVRNINCTNDATLPENKQV